MYTTMETLENYLPIDRVEQLRSNLGPFNTNQISLSDVLNSNGILDAQISFPAFAGYEKLGLCYLVSCLKSIQPILKNQKFNLVFENIEKMTLGETEVTKEWEMLESLMKEIQSGPTYHTNSKIYQKLINFCDLTEDGAAIYREVAVAEGEQAIYCLLRWAMYSNPEYKTNKRIELETKLHQNSFSGALQACLNSISYKKASEIIQNNDIYKNVMQCCLDKQQNLFEKIILSQYAETAD